MQITEMEEGKHWQRCSMSGTARTNIVQSSSKVVCSSSTANYMGSTNGLGRDAEKNKENLKFGGVGEEAELDQEEVMERGWMWLQHIAWNQQKINLKCSSNHKWLADVMKFLSNPIDLLAELEK